MEKKEYKGLVAEVISFGINEIASQVVAESACYLGSVQYHTTDGNGNSMPIGVCWNDSTGYSFDWAQPQGYVYINGVEV